jgi:hypothetical protein
MYTCVFAIGFPIGIEQSCVTGAEISNVQQSNCRLGGAEMIHQSYIGKTTPPEENIGWYKSIAPYHQSLGRSSYRA